MQLSVLPRSTASCPPSPPPPPPAPPRVSCGVMLTPTLLIAGYIDDKHGWNAVTDTGDLLDDQGHGTHCAGVVGAVGNNSIGVVGVNWNVALMGCKFLDSTGSGSTSDAIECIEYSIANGAHITSNSWGGGGYSQALDAIIGVAEAAGQLFFAAAGNDFGSDNDVEPHYPSNYDHSNVVSVASTSYDFTYGHEYLSLFSNIGNETVHIAAPGGNVLSTYPTDMGAYQYLSGTSMATPHVAGAAALLMAVYPNIPAAEVKQLLLDWGDPMPGLIGRTVSGRRLNVLRAIENAGLDSPDPEPLPPQYVSPTEAFQENNVDNFDLTGTTLVLSWSDDADGDGQSGYTACPESTSVSGDWAFDPSGGTELPEMGDDESREVEFPDGFTFPFFSQTYGSVWVGANGYLTFGTGDSSWHPSAHFSVVRISGLFTDMTPSAEGISWKMVDDKWFVVTFEAVPDYGAPNRLNSFQMALHSNGDIKLYYKEVMAQPMDSFVAVGVSMGYAPIDIVLTDLSSCGAEVEVSAECCESLATDDSFVGSGGSKAVCAASHVGTGGCGVKMLWQEAYEHCQDRGARLCTVEELSHGEAAQTGCLNNNKLVWSSNRCVDGHIKARMMDGADPMCIKDTKPQNNKALVKCCADSCQSYMQCPTGSTISISSSVAECHSSAQTLVCEGNFDVLRLGSSYEVSCDGDTLEPSRRRRA